MALPNPHQCCVNTVDTPCCDSVPSTLHASISGCATAETELHWDGTNWKGDFTCDGTLLTLRMVCPYDFWHLDITGAGCGGSNAAAIAQCHPFLLTDTVSVAALCPVCPFGPPWTVTITE